MLRRIGMRSFESSHSVEAWGVGIPPQSIPPSMTGFLPSNIRPPPHTGCLCPTPWYRPPPSPMPPPSPAHRLSLPYTLVQTAKRNVVVSHLEESVARITRLLDAFSVISQ